MEIVSRPENGIRLNITPRIKESKKIWTAENHAASLFYQVFRLVVYLESISKEWCFVFYSRLLPCSVL
jgi:hypothetical protein